MSYTLRTGEMLAALQEARHPDFQLYKATVESISTLMAQALAVHTGVNMGPRGATYDLGMVAASFHPKYKTQLLPIALDGFDNKEEWGQ